MSKKLLIESRISTPLTLLEGVQSKTQGCLGTLRGPCADFKNPTRNGNFYSRKLWVNVFNSDLVKESLEDLVLIGELDHPGDRLETRLKYSAIVMTDYEFDDDKGVLIGTFDILDTPQGRILRSLLDYGCKIGVSSRGEGDVTEDIDKSVVDEDSYYFVGFDAVCLPAVKKAKPSLNESLKRKSLKESLESQISSAASQYEFNVIKKVVETVALPDSDSLLESVENKSKELEGTTGSSTLLEDLEESTSQIQILTEENKRLKQEVTNCKSRIRRFVQSRVKMSESLRSKDSEFENLNRDYNVASFRLGHTSRKVESLKSQLNEALELNQGLNEELRTNRSLISDQESKISCLEESLEKSQKVSRDRSVQSSILQRRVSALTKQLQESKSRESSLRETTKKATTALKESQKAGISQLRTYADQKAKSLGLDSTRILESVKPGTTLDQVNKLLEEEVDRRDRYRKLPQGDDKLIKALSEATVRVKSGVDTVSEEDQQTVTFMEQFYQNKS